MIVLVRSIYLIDSMIVLVRSIYLVDSMIVLVRSIYLIVTSKEVEHFLVTSDCSLHKLHGL